MVVLLFHRLLTSVQPTPVPPMSNPVHLSHPYHPTSTQPAQKTVFRDTIQLIQYDPAHPIRSSRYNTIQPIIQYNPSSVSSYQNDPSKNHRQLTHCFSIHILYHISWWCSFIWFSPSTAASTAMHLLSSSATAYYAASFASDLDIPTPKSNILASLIASPTGQSFEVTCECLIETHQHCFCCFFPVVCSWLVLLLLPCWR